MPLFIGASEEIALRRANERARAKPIPIDDVMRAGRASDQSTNVLTLAEREGAPAPRDPQQVELPFGYRVAISWEEQPAGMCLHLSMSSSAPGKVPRPEALDMVLEAIGIKRADFYCRTWVEEFAIDGKPGGLAVNVVVLVTATVVGHA